jgi:hypothetical protein
VKKKSEENQKHRNQTVNSNKQVRTKETGCSLSNLKNNNERKCC